MRALAAFVHGRRGTADTRRLVKQVDLFAMQTLGFFTAGSGGESISDVLVRDAQSFYRREKDLYRIGVAAAITPFSDGPQAFSTMMDTGPTYRRFNNDLMWGRSFDAELNTPLMMAVLRSQGINATAFTEGSVPPERLSEVFNGQGVYPPGLVTGPGWGRLGPAPWPRTPVFNRLLYNPLPFSLWANWPLLETIHHADLASAAYTPEERNFFFPDGIPTLEHWLSTSKIDLGFLWTAILTEIAVHMIFFMRV